MMNAPDRPCVIMRDVRLLPDRRAEQIMAMPAVGRRWTAREVREIIDKNPLATPRYELVDGELLVTPSPKRRVFIAESTPEHAVHATQ
jgi:hypothetical protein